MSRGSAPLACKAQGSAPLACKGHNRRRGAAVRRSVATGANGSGDMGCVALACEGRSHAVEASNEREVASSAFACAYVADGERRLSHSQTTGSAHRDRRRPLDAGINLEYRDVLIGVVPDELGIVALLQTGRVGHDDLGRLR